MATTTPTPEIKRLRMERTQALKNTHLADIRVTLYEKKLKDLQRQSKTLQKDTAAKKENATDAIMEYAKASCRELCYRVYEKFSREVRDMIYDYVVDCNKFCYVPEWIDDPNSFMESSHHWWDPNFVGYAMRREIGESVFRSTPFHFEDNFHLMSKFRIKDHWYLGFPPVSFVTKVDIRIQAEKYQLKPKVHDDKLMKAYWGPLDWATRDRVDDDGLLKKPSDLLLGLESIFGFKSGTAVTIKIVLHPTITSTGLAEPLEQEEWMCDTIVPLIFPTVQRLKDSSYRVRIVLLGDWDDWKFSNPRPGYISDWNPTCVETLTNSFWNYVKAEQEAQEQAPDDAEAE